MCYFRKDVQPQIDFYSCEFVSSSDMRKNLISIMEVGMNRLSTCEMFASCDVLHETKQKNLNKLSRVCSTD